MKIVSHIFIKSKFSKTKHGTYSFSMNTTDKIIIRYQRCQDTAGNRKLERNTVSQQVTKLDGRQDT